jgi:sugar transferase (PEP-CTERM/EpsH1 system associated)
MKILHVVPSFGLGGMEKVICVVIEKTSDCYEHEILALDANVQASGWIKDSNVQFVNFEKPHQRRTYFQALYRCLRKIRPEVLMTYNWGATDAIWLGRLAGIQHIVHSEHGFNVDEGRATVWKRDMIRFLVYRLASKLVVVSHELEQMMRRRFHLRSKRVIRISNGIDARLYSPDFDERQRVRRSLGFADTDLAVGFSGRLDAVKNLDLLLDIFSRSTSHNYPFRLLIVGDGPERQHLEARCQAEGIHPYVNFVGEQTQVLAYLRAMDVFLLTSLREQMPLTVLEAMAVGVPVIATRVGELPYMVNDGTDGFIRDLTAPVEQFVQPLHSLLCSARRTRMGDAARKKVIQHFQLKTMVQQYTDLIQEFDHGAAG